MGDKWNRKESIIDIWDVVLVVLGTDKLDRMENALEMTNETDFGNGWTCLETPGRVAWYCNNRKNDWRKGNCVVSS